MFASSTLESYVAVSPEQKRALSTARGFASNHKAVYEGGNSLTFCGRPGNGKTHLACAIGYQWLDAGYTVIYTKVIEVIRAIRETWNRNSRLFDLIDWRYSQLRPTLIVSNVDARGLKEALGPRTYDRLLQNGSSVVVFDWESYRSQANPIRVTVEERRHHTEGKSLSEHLRQMVRPMTLAAATKTIRDTSAEIEGFANRHRLQTRTDNAGDQIR